MRGPVFCVWSADLLFFGILIGLPLLVLAANFVAERFDK